MTNSANSKAPFWYWIVSLLALLWYGLGIYYYLSQAYNTSAYRAMYTPEQLMVVDKMPAWAIGAFAVAVFTGIIGVIGMFLRKEWSKTLFLISLAGIIVQYIYNVFIGKMYELFSLPENIRYFIIPIIAYLLYYIVSDVSKRQWFNKI
ncbi:MAG: hypothetical protein HKP48_06155 [Winogradskyella sp.]|uniref:hypothetical protein n=1 Tax=Winogradskyella sp. TaxID=1883156 RepID=UPI0017F11B92|nr:hypothetical protein [Winogradskyella sp.]MBT8244751.1 hypothetical protein [Winogradskyella sp.]NNK22877.1 hypothetical protein [Winogradskyella sp.]